MIKVHVRQGRAKVTHGTVNGLDRVVDELTRAPGVAGAIQFGALKLDTRDFAILPGDLHWVMQKVQVKAAGGACGGIGGVVVLLHQPVSERVDHGLDLVIGLDSGIGGLIKVEVLLVQDNVHIAGVAELAQFHGRELHLSGAAAAKNVNVRDRR